MRTPRFSPSDTRGAVQRLLAGGLTESEADAIVDVIGGLSTKEDLRPLATREELYRALWILAVVFAAIVALVVAVVVALLTRL